jgi:DNA polymerase III epsilon subunit-like protein
VDGHLLRYRQDVTYALIDLETFNLNLSFKYNRPWQVGILLVKGEKVIDGRDIRINWPDAPYLSIGKEAALITKFDPVLHKQLAILPDAAFPKFWPLLEQADYIIMHNGLKFDLYLLKDYANMMGKPWKWMMPKILDTKSIAQGVKMNIPYKPKDGSFLEYQYRMANIIVKGIKTNLTTLGKEYGITHDYDKLHDAIVDLELNLKVWNKLKYQVEI